MSMERLLPPMSSSQDLKRPTSPDYHEKPPALSKSKVVAAAVSGEVDLDDTPLKEFSPFYRVRLNEKHDTWRGQQEKIIMTFIGTRKRTFSSWRRWETGTKRINFVMNRTINKVSAVIEDGVATIRLRLLTKILRLYSPWATTRTAKTTTMRHVRELRRPTKRVPEITLLVIRAHRIWIDRVR